MRGICITVRGKCRRGSRLPLRARACAGRVCRPPTGRCDTRHSIAGVRRPQRPQRPPFAPCCSEHCVMLRVRHCEAITAAHALDAPRDTRRHRWEVWEGKRQIGRATPNRQGRSPCTVYVLINCMPVRPRRAAGGHGWARARPRSIFLPPTEPWRELEDAAAHGGSTATLCIVARVIRPRAQHACR
jgi:hypothetical protein